MTNEATFADHLRTTVLPDHKVARLRPSRLREYFAPCLLALDIDVDHPQFGPPAKEAEIEQPSGPVVYFVKGAMDAIKIGFTSQSLKSRVQSIQNGSPVRLKIMAWRAGSVEDERAYHERFAAYRLHGEWFEPHPDILAEIERLNAGKGT